MFAKKMFALLLSAALGVGIWSLIPYLLEMKTVLAQTGNPTETALDNSVKKPQDAKKDDVSPELKEKAVKLLSVVARETGQFASPKNRVSGQIVAANLLWKYDEPTARNLFQNALGELQAMLNNLAVAASDEDGAKENEEYAKRYAVSEMRRVYLLALAEHDPKAALVALSSLRLAPSKEDYDPLKEDELELQIASTVAKKDPQQAYELAARGLREGVTYNTMSTLADLYKNDAETGAKLARDVLAKIKTSKIRPLPTNTNVAASSNIALGNNSNATAATASATNYIDLSQIAQFITTAEGLNRRAAKDGKNPKVPALTDGEMRELADFIGQSFNRQTTAEPWSIAASMSIIGKYSPTAAQLIKRKLNAQQLQSLSAYGDGNRYYEERDTQTADEIVADADKIATMTERDPRYADAARKALEADDLEKAAEIADKISNKTAYAYIFDELKTTAPVIKARRGDIAEVHKLLATIKDEDEKVTSLTELIVALAGKGEKEAAGKLMDEANQFLPARLKRKPNLETTLKIGAADALVQPGRGFNLIENSIAQMNDLIAAGLMIDEFYDYGTMEADEVLFDAMERQGVSHTTNVITTIKNLAAADFDRTVNLADKFSRPEIRTFVRLKIAEALLDPEAATREKTLRQQYQSERDVD